MKFFLASFNRASEGAISYLRKKLDEDNLLAYVPKNADYIIAVGDRIETFNFVLYWFRKNKPIIHLWAGEISQGTHDEVYRHSMTLMSMMQLCTNETAKRRVDSLCSSVDKTPNAHVIGNVMLDDLQTDISLVPNVPYSLILYNPPTSLSKEEVLSEIEKIKFIKCRQAKQTIWIAPNGDKYSDLISPYVTHRTLSRPKFLGLLKHCNVFITNSSSQYYEAPFVMDKPHIISIGERNKERESKHAKMHQENATEAILNLLVNIK